MSAFAFVRGPRFACEPAYHQIASERTTRPATGRALLGDALALCDEAATKLIARTRRSALMTCWHTFVRSGWRASRRRTSSAPFVEVPRWVTKARRSTTLRGLGMCR